MTKRILVTGGSGFIGAALVKRLLESGHEVRIFDNFSRGNVRRLDGIVDAVECVSGDVRDPDAVKRAVTGVDAVHHLAFVNGTEFFYSRPALVLEVGLKGILNVVDACIAHGVGELVVASSSEVYQTPPCVPTDEAVPLIVPDPFNPRFSYGGSKIASELVAINYGRESFERVLVFRPHNVYGPDMGWEHVIPQFVTRMIGQAANATRIDFPIQGSGSETRAFVHIEDFMDALMIVIDRGEHLGIYHVGSDEETSIRSLAGQVATILGIEATIVPGTLTAGSTPRRCPDISKIRALGYAGARALAERLPDTVRWYRDNIHLHPSRP
jgi:nucleoside-diphosphate-sugar epimerase